MPGSTTLFPAIPNDEVIKKPQQNMMGTRQPPPVAPRTTSITLQSWEQATSSGEANYGSERYARSASTDSLESSGSSSSGGGNANNRISDVGNVEYIPTRTIGKTPKLPPHNPLQFVKVQSPLYIKAEQQIKLTKEVKITREALKESEEEWQSNLDNWKSRRRKVSEKVIQRAEEMRQIEAEEQLRQEQLLQQQKRIKKFSEIVEKKSARYNLDLYIGQGDDSGLGGTPEPDEIIDGQSSLLRSDTSEGMTSESESVDSDIHKSEKIAEKEPPKVPQKPYSRLKKSHSINYDDGPRNPDELFQHCLSKKELVISENNSSAEPSDVEGHAADTEATSSEEDVTFSGQTGNTDSGLDSLGDCRKGDLADSASDLSQDGSLSLEKSNEKLHLDLTSDELEEEKKAIEEFNSQVNKGHNQSIRINIKPGDNKGFGFTLKGGKDQSSSAYIENVLKGGAADEMGLKDGDKIISLNGELTADYSHASLIFSIKQAVYTGILDLVVNRSDSFGIPNPEVKPRESRKGKSFAEKLAIFSAGINAPTSLDEPKSSAKLLETKRESLVLRRRSAFENGKTDSVNALNRRASCISHSANTHPEKILEKRHSVDFILPQNLVSENNSNRKGPPPPVPVKPKIKSKPAYFDLNKHVIKTNGSTDGNLPSGSLPNGAENHYSRSQSDHENLDTLDSRYHEEDLSPKSENQDTSFESNTINSVENYLSEESNFHLENDDLENDENNISSVISSSSNGDSPKEEFSKSNCSTNFDVVGDIITDNIFTSFEANEPVEQNGEILDVNDAFLEVTEEARYSFFDRTVEFSPDSEDKLYEDPFEPESEAGTSEEVCTEEKITDETSLHIYAESTSEQTVEIPNDIDSECILETDIVREIETNSVSSACNFECDNEDNFDKTDDTECNDFQETNESEDLEGKNDNQSNTSPLCLSLEKIDEDDVISASTTTSSETPDTETVIETLPSNLSPLPNDESNGEDSSKLLNCQDEESDHPVDSKPVDCQANEMSSNEKSSENETIVNYENGSDVNYRENEGIVNYGENDYNYDENDTELNYDENETDINFDDNDIPLSYDEIESELNSGVNEIAQKYDENDDAQNYDDNETAQNYDESELNCDEVETAQSYSELESAQNFSETNEKILTSEDDLTEPYNTTSNNTNNGILDKTFYGDQQDDEYAQELEESLDQITSLDIIDRIEQSLMDQLQKEDPYEDMSTNLNSQFESDIDNPWLYYPEDAEYLEDLTPRKLEPPKEPPPPPPPPDTEDNDNKATSLNRTNSTKRLKRELWRRRSDFLGLESSESIDVDNIPPPPPGLEELLKQEREQTQWLEKRLSLADPEIDVSTYSTESACLDSGNYSNNDYSDYILDDNVENTKDNIDTEQEPWKENMEEESLYETNYGVQYETAAEPLSTVIEEPIKLPESPQHKAKQNLHSLGAAPKAKIMDSTKWITEKVTTVSKKPLEPVFRQASYNQNYWLAQDGERRRNMQYADSQVDRRYSMPPVYSNTHPDVTVRTWGDREYEYQQHRPRSAVYDRAAMGGNVYDQYMDKKDLQRTQSLDSRRDLDYETDLLEPEVHKCSCCGKGLCEGSAMGIEALRLYFHIECFRCCSCHMQLGNGSCGTDVQVKNNQLYCPSCFTVD